MFRKTKILITTFIALFLIVSSSRETVGNLLSEHLPELKSNTGIEETGNNVEENEISSSVDAAKKFSNSSLSFAIPESVGFFRFQNEQVLGATIRATSAKAKKLYILYNSLQLDC